MLHRFDWFNMKNKYYWYPSKGLRKYLVVEDGDQQVFIPQDDYLRLAKMLLCGIGDLTGGDCSISFLGRNKE